MRYSNVGKSSLKASKIILGTWQAGKESWADIDDRQTTQAIRAAIDLGITTIDTAAIYGNGYSEKIIAAALHSVAREKYQILTKVFSNKLKYQSVLDECEKSLRRLDTDYVDLYQIHWPSGSFGSPIVPIEETMGALNKLKDQGKILNIGVSNFSKEQIIAAQRYGEICSNQPPYSLIWRPYDAETNPYSRKNGIGILAYSPLAQGLLTGKFKKGHKFAAGDNRQDNRLMQPDVFANVEKVLAVMHTYADRYKTSLGNIALNWLISQESTFAIVGVRSLDQLMEASKACEFFLTADELGELDRASEAVTKNMDQTHEMWSWKV